jgi:hypothetical protein
MGGAGKSESQDRLGTSGLEASRGGFECRPGGDNIIYQEDPAAFDGSPAVECVGQVSLALLAVQTTLGRCGAAATEGGEVG